MLDWWSVVLVHSSLARNFIAEALSGLSDATRHTFAVVKEYVLSEIDRSHGSFKSFNPSEFFFVQDSTFDDTFP